MKDSVFSFRRSSSNRLSLQLDRKKERREEVQLKRASWSAFPLRFSSSSSSFERKSFSFGRKCNSSEDLKPPKSRNSPPKTNFQRGSNASIRSAVSTSSSASSSTSSSVRTAGSSSITSILEGSGSDACFYDSCGGTVNDSQNYPVTRTASDVFPSSRHPYAFAQVAEEDLNEYASLPSLQEDGDAHSHASPKIIFTHRKTPDTQHRSRKQLVRELELVRRTGSLPGGLEAPREKPVEEKEEHTPPKQLTKHKHKKSFSFIHNSKFLGRLEARASKREAREARPPEVVEVRTDYDASGQDETTATTDNSSPSRPRPPAVQPSPPPPPQAQSPPPPQFSLAAFLNNTFSETHLENEISHGSVRNQQPDVNSTSVGVGNGHNTAPHHQVLEATNPRYHPHDHDFEVNDQFVEVVNPRYWADGCDSPDITEGNYVNGNSDGDQRGVNGAACGNGGDLNGDLGEEHAGHNSLGVIEDIIEEEEEEEEEESECELVEFADSFCFERRLEDQLAEMSGWEAEGEVVEAATGGGPAPVEPPVKTPAKRAELRLILTKPQNDMVKRVQKTRLLRHISEEGEAINSAGEDEVELRTPSTPRSPAIDIDNMFEQKHREIAETEDEMSHLRDLTTRLQLATRRPSYLDWVSLIKERGRQVGEALAAHTPTVLEEDRDPPHQEQDPHHQDQELSLEKRRQNLNTAMDWVRRELVEMRQQDQQLARQLLQLHLEVQRVRLLHSCHATRALVEEVACGEEEARSLTTSDLCDLPPDLRDTFSPVLREMGVTRMNITSRRFSLR